MEIVIALWFVYFIFFATGMTDLPILLSLGISLIAAIITVFGVLLLLTLFFRGPRFNYQKIRKMFTKYTTNKKIKAKSERKKTPRCAGVESEEIFPSTEDLLKELERKLEYLDFRNWNQDGIEDVIDKILEQTIAAEGQLHIMRYLLKKVNNLTPTKKLCVDECRNIFIATLEEILRSFSNMENILVLGGTKYAKDYNAENVDRKLLDLEIQNSAKKIIFLQDINKEILYLVNHPDNPLEDSTRRNQIKLIAKFNKLEAEQNKLIRTTASSESELLNQFYTRATH